MSQVKSMMIVGVGGQGSLLASKLLGRVFLSEGFDVKVSEVHGMSQRGGSVVTYVKYGEKVYSPIVQEGEADLIISFEELEAARYLSCLKEGGRVVVSSQQIMPMPVVTGMAKYPEGLTEKIERLGCAVKRVDALSLAQKAGNVKAVNVVLIGVVAKGLPIAKEKWLAALEACVPAKLLEVNQKAFEYGYES